MSEEDSSSPEPSAGLSAATGSSHSIGSGVRTSLSWMLPRSAEDLKKKRRNSELWNAETWGQLGRSHGIMDEGIHFLDFFFLDELGGIKVLHFPGDLGAFIIRNLTKGFDQDKGFEYIVQPGMRFNTVPWMSWSPTSCESRLTFSSLGIRRPLSPPSARPEKFRS